MIKWFQDENCYLCVVGRIHVGYVIKADTTYNAIFLPAVKDVDFSTLESAKEYMEDSIKRYLEDLVADCVDDINFYIPGESDQ